MAAPCHSWDRLWVDVGTQMDPGQGSLRSSPFLEPPRRQQQIQAKPNPTTTSASAFQCFPGFSSLVSTPVPSPDQGMMLVGSSWKIPAAPRPILGYRQGCHPPVTCQRDRQDGPSTLCSFIPRCHQHIPGPVPHILPLLPTWTLPMARDTHPCPRDTDWEPLDAHTGYPREMPSRCPPLGSAQLPRGDNSRVPSSPPAPPARALGWDSQQPGPARAASKPRQRSRARMLGGDREEEEEEGQASASQGRQEMEAGAAHSIPAEGEGG